ncbi:MAG: hypothetical protein WC137_02345 [Alphaproteobacteria bacterium]
MKITIKSFLKSLMLLAFITISLNAFSVQVEKTAETAAAAKTVAINEARRSAFSDILSNQVSDVQAKNLAEQITDDELVSMIDSVSIENEKSDSTSYSADIIVDFDKKALNKWLENHELGTIIDAPAITGRTPIFLELNSMYEFAQVMRVSRETGADLKIINISGNKISANIRENSYESFVSLVRDAGGIISY